MTKILAIGASECLRSTSDLAWLSDRRGNRGQAWRYKVKLSSSEPQEAVASQLGNREIPGSQRRDPHRTHHGGEALKQVELTRLLPAAAGWTVLSATRCEAEVEAAPAGVVRT